MKAVVFTLGCKVNECESNSIIAGLEKAGYEVFDTLVYADLYIVNTCAVTKEAEKKSRQTASRIKKLNPNAKIIYMGCASQHNPQAFISKSKDCLVTGTFDKAQILNQLNEKGVCLASSKTKYQEMPFGKTLKTRTFIKVQDGCNNFCSYCIIPYLRGRSRGRNPSEVLAEIVSANPQEAVLTGINLTAYEYEGKTFIDLIKTLCSLDCRIRLGSLEMAVITDEFLQALKGLKNFAPHFHLSLQSGSNSVLKSMNRHYTAEQFSSGVELIRKYFPNAGITTDIIVGFPTETDQDFLDTLALIDRVKFSDIHPFIFSPRENTVAYKMPDLDHKIKKDRLDKLIGVKVQLKNEFTKSQQGKKLQMLTEEFDGEYTVGYTENYLRAYLKGEHQTGEMVSVEVFEPFRDGAIVKTI